MTDKIVNIIEESVLAPSGDNAQPWRFVVKGNRLLVYNIPGGDKTMYNYRERGSYIAHGALLENISIVAKQKGLNAEINIAPDSSQPELTAVVDFASAQILVQDLYPYIAQRCTNRKAYKPQELPQEFLNDLLSLDEDGVSIHVLSDRQKIKELAQGLSLNERLILENINIHQPLFSYIRWTPEEEAEKGDGLYIKTLELAPPAEKAFKIFINWKVINVLKNFGVTRMVARDSAKLYETSSVFVMLTVTSPSVFSYIIAGRVMQRVWLRATARKISAQPTAALFYLAQRISEGDTEKFTASQTQEILEFETKAKSLFDVSSPVAMLMRLGYADAPSAVSKKRKPQINIETQTKNELD